MAPRQGNDALRKKTGDKQVQRTISKAIPENHHSKSGVALQLLTLVVLTVVTCLPVTKAKFTNWDDPVYVLNNQKVHNLSVENTAYFFTHSSATNYHPLTMLSLSADYALAGKEPSAGNGKTQPDAFLFHLVNLILHLINVILVYFFAFRLSEKNGVIAFLTALLFAIHPMHIESVAWIAERKDVLYAMFLLAGLISYLDFVQKQRKGCYYLALLFFLLSLLSKPAAVVFPLLMFCVDFFLRRKFGFKLILEKIPFLILSLVFGVITLGVQSQVSIAGFDALPPFQRLLCVSYGFLMYLAKCMVPAGLSAFYPFPSLDSGGNLPFLCYLSPVLVLLIAGLVLFSARYNRVITFGFLFFLCSIFLVLQILSVGMALMADRYTYVPFIGLFFIIGYFADRLIKNRKRTVKFSVIFLLSIYTIILCYASNERCRIWKNSESLWSDVLEKFPACDIAYNNRGNHYMDTERFDLALADFEKAIGFGAKDPMVVRNLGNVLVKLDQPEKAIAAYSRSLGLDIHNRDSNAYLCYLNRGNLYARTRQFTKALEDYRLALEQHPGSTSVLANRAYALMDMKDYPAAVEAFTTIIKIIGTNDDFYLKRGFCELSMNKFPEALNDFETCLRLNPLNPLALFNTSIIYFNTGRYDEAYKFAMKAKEAGFEVNAEYLGDLHRRSGK